MVFVAALVVLLGAVAVAKLPPAQADAKAAARQVEVGEAGGLSAYLQGAISDLAGDPGRATQGYLNALADDPDNMTLRQRVMELSLTGGDIPTAIRLAKSLPEIEQTTMSRLVLALDLAREGKIKEARRDMRAAAKTAPGLLPFELLQVYLDFADGMPTEDLVKRLEKLPLPAGLDGRRKYHEARLWLKQGSYEKGLLLLEEAQRVEPNAIFTTVLLGRMYMQQGQPDRAVSLFESFRAANPAVGVLIPDAREVMAREVQPFASTLDEDLAVSLFDFGLMVWSEGVMTPARQLINMALWLNPSEVYHRYYAGILLEMAGDYPAAVVEYQRLVDDPNLGVGAQLRMAEVRFKMGEEEQGWRQVRALAKAHPDSVVIQRSMAQMAFERKEFAGAVRIYGDLLTALPEDAAAKERVELLFARGAAYERMGDYQRAEKDFKEVLVLDPANGQVMNYLGYMWVDNGVNLEEAFNLLKKAHLLLPQDAAVTDSVGWAYYKRGDYEQAVTYLELAAEQDPESAEITDHLGDAYFRLGREEDARKFWRLALELFDKYGEAPRDSFRADVDKKLQRGL